MTSVRLKAKALPEKMVILPFLMAMRAAMKKVLSPISETKMALRDATKPEVNPRPLFGAIVVMFIMVVIVVVVVVTSSSSHGEVADGGDVKPKTSDERQDHWTKLRCAEYFLFRSFALFWLKEQYLEF